MGFEHPLWACPPACRWFGHRHSWIALLDVDEFVVIRESLNSQAQPHLPSFLKAYEPYGGLMVHWQLFGPSG